MEKRRNGKEYGILLRNNTSDNIPIKDIGNINGMVQPIQESKRTKVRLPFVLYPNKPTYIELRKDDRKENGFYIVTRDGEKITLKEKIFKKNYSKLKEYTINNINKAKELWKSNSK